eukprot:CAMPEP_0197324106 /NCGR_PEP_ID=MMETSP0891-20130614/70912_1 /TAXON_ID=44058 ORGANISM="Aureoumbra lagunensis, Strain CCMP1510" /NCGR_SAMPLE_ID=MMETSP0891 /ASSEMBLY_ACC=CAM_ASM_000534 /LENGTH=380 /DNA_ID=CAMNT_0042816865 /DNA_START=980 /DNA_END=2122 /DNA_ORIENTATION=+
MPLKLIVGFIAPKPLTINAVTTLATAWGVWGEVAFVIVDLARDRIADSTANGIVLAVLVSMVIMPSILRATLDKDEKHARHLITEAYHDTEPSSQNTSTSNQPNKSTKATYFCIQTRSPAHWNLIDAVLAAVPSACEIIDVRSWHPNDHIGASHCVVELYFRDPDTNLPATTNLSQVQQQVLVDRAAFLVEKLKKALGSPTKDYDIRVKRWLPGFFHKPLFQQQQVLKKPLAVRSCSDPSHLFQKAWSRVDSRKYLDAESLTGAFRVQPSHELDGFVHTDAHRPFPLPDDADDPLLAEDYLSDVETQTEEEKRSEVSPCLGQPQQHVASSLFEGLSTLLVDVGDSRKSPRSLDEEEKITVVHEHEEKSNNDDAILIAEAS